MLKAGEVFEIAMLAHDNLHRLKTRLIAARWSISHASAFRKSYSLNMSFVVGTGRVGNVISAKSQTRLS
jgi:hypothetical protein